MSEVADVEQLDDVVEEPVLDRRTLLKTGAGAVTAGTLLGAGPAQHLSLSATQTTAALDAADIPIGIGTGAGVKITQWISNVGGKPEGDDNSALKDSIYNTAVAVAQGREAFEQEMKQNFTDANVGESPFANSVWSAIRATAAESIAAGESTAKTKKKAQDALEKQIAISANNILQRWNTAATALGPSYDTSVREGLDMFYIPDVGDASPSTGLESDQTGVDKFQPDGKNGYSIGKITLTPPGNRSLVDGLPDSDPTQYSFTFDVNGSNRALAPVTSNAGNGGIWGSDGSAYRLSVTHPNYSTEVVLDGRIYDQTLRHINDEYNNISSDLTTYVDNLESALDQGAISVSEILTPRELVSEFSDSDQNQRIAAELAAAGASVPLSVGYEAKVSHPSLAAAEKWGNLFISFSGDEISVEPGTTIAAADYRTAYLGFESAASGEYVSEVLSSADGDLSILDVVGVDGQEEVSTDLEAASGGRINLGPSVPDAVSAPNSVEGSVKISVIPANGSPKTIPVSEVEQDSNGDWYIPADASPVSEGTIIETVEVVPAVQYETTSETVTDPTTVDSDKVTSLLESQRDLTNRIKDLESSGGGLFAGGLFSGLIPEFGPDIPWFEENIPGGSETVYIGGGILTVLRFT